MAVEHELSMTIVHTVQTSLMMKQRVLQTDEQFVIPHRLSLGGCYAWHGQWLHVCIRVRLSRLSSQLILRIAVLPALLHQWVVFGVVRISQICSHRQVSRPSTPTPGLPL